jgi:hypothetical protein
MILGGLVLIGVGAALPYVVAGLPAFFRPLVVGLGLVEAAIGALLLIKTPAP